MSNYDELARLAQNASAEEKLQTMRNMMITPFAAIRAHAELIRLSLERGETQNVEPWSNTIIEAIDDLRAILDILTTMPKSEDQV